MRLAIGLVMTLAAFAVAGRRVHYLYRLIGSGQPAPGRLDGIGTRAKDQLREVFGQRKLLQWSVPGVAHFFTFWAFIVLAATILEAYGALFDRDFAIPVIGHWPLLGLPRGLLRASPCCSSLAMFTVIRLAQAPPARQRRSRFYGSHTGAAWLVLFMIFNVIWTLFLYRGAQINTGVFPLRRRGVRVAGGGHGAGAARRRRQRGPGDDRHPAADRGRARLPGARRLLQAPAHLPGAAQRPDQARAQRARPAAADHGRRQAGRLREPRRAGRGHRVRPRQDRGLHLEGHARLRDLHRVRSLPGPVPGLEHRQAAVAQAGDHGPARPPVRQGVRRRVEPTSTQAPTAAAGRAAAGRAGRRDRPRRAVVLHHLRRLRRAVPGRHRARRPHRRHAPLPGAGRVVVPVRGGHDAEEPGEQGQPVGHVRAEARLEWTQGLDFEVPVVGEDVEDLVGGRLPLLGRLRRRAGGPGQEDHPGRSPSCCTSPA